MVLTEPNTRIIYNSTLEEHDPHSRHSLLKKAFKSNMSNQHFKKYCQKEKITKADFLPVKTGEGTHEFIEGWGNHHTYKVNCYDFLLLEACDPCYYSKTLMGSAHSLGCYHPLIVFKAAVHNVNVNSRIRRLPQYIRESITEDDLKINNYPNLTESYHNKATLIFNTHALILHAEHNFLTSPFFPDISLGKLFPNAKLVI